MDRDEAEDETCGAPRWVEVNMPTESEPVTIVEGDCLSVMARLPAGSVDAVVTDPPYGLEFMGKEWDSFPLRDRGERLTGNGNPTTSRGFGGNVAYGKSSAALRQFGQWCEVWSAAALRVLKPGGYMLAMGGTRTYHRLACAVEDAGFEIRDCLMFLYATGFPKGKGCLKPAYEPVLLCRKPGPTVLPLGIDECRIGADTLTYGWGTPGAGRERECNLVDRGDGRTPDGRDLKRAKERMARYDSTDAMKTVVGRWPTNVIHDGSDESVDLLGTASRFFLTAKASRKERGKGNSHPTVKPLSLMRWLVRLVSRRPNFCERCGGTGKQEAGMWDGRAYAAPAGTCDDCQGSGSLGGIVLDPFGGSGTTGLACLAENRRCILIEKEPAYVEIARRRVAEAMGTGLLAGVG